MAKGLMAAMLLLCAAPAMAQDAADVRPHGKPGYQQAFGQQAFGQQEVRP